ncbi:MAG: hypothetical protein Q9177_002433 [Variospora cf. flavescens]
MQRQRQELAGEVPSLQYLFRSVEKASGRLKQVFARLCNNFKDLSTLPSVLPKEDKYVCLVTGSLSAIARASTNHQEIANAVADSLEELGQDMAFWNSLITGYTSLKTLHRYIRDLYVVVFEFLTEIFIKWSKSSWKRFLTSFDERAFDKLFSEKKGRIRAIEQRMLRLTTLDFQIGVNEKVNKLEEGFQKFFECQEGSATDQRRLLLELGTSIQQLLDERAGQRTLQITEVEHALASGSGIPSTIQPKHPQECELIISSTVDTLNRSNDGTSDGAYHPEFKEIVVSESSYRRNAILDAIPLLKIACTHEIQALLDMTTQASQLMIDAEVQRQLLQWNKNPSFNNLWIQGPHEVSNPSQNTLAALCLIALSRQNDIPCLIFLLPETFVSMRNLSLNRFERLQDGLLGIEGTLDLLQDSRSLVPPYLYCVISGIEHLEDRGDEQHSRKLLLVLSTVIGGYQHSARADLHQHWDRANDQTEKVSESLQNTKTCFTTDGYADSLAHLVEQGCLVKVEYSDEAEQRPEEEIHTDVKPSLLPHAHQRP